MTNDKPLKLREGICYRTAGGEKRGPMTYGGGGVWKDKNDPLEPGDRLWNPDGTRWRSDPENDLVAEWHDSPVREVTRKEIVPGVYGKVLVNEGPQGGFYSVAMEPVKDPAEIRAAAATITLLADALEGGAA